MRPMWQVIFFLTLGLAAGHAFAAMLEFDTSPYAGQDVSVAYDLIDGSPATSSVSFDAPVIDGVGQARSGSLIDSNFFNEELRAITLGESLSLSFMATEIGIPQPGFFPDSFSLFLLGDDNLPLFPTADPTGADSLLQWDLGDGPAQVFAGTLSSGNPEADVPEPSSLWLLFLGLVCIALFSQTRGSRRNVTRAALMGLVALSVSAQAAQDLNRSTDLGMSTQMDATGLRLNRRTRTFDSQLTIKNTSEQPLELPYSVVVLGLPDGVVLANATTATESGVPVITVDEGQAIAPGQSRSITLRFENGTNQRIPLALRLVRFEQPIPDIAEIQGPDANDNGVRDDLEPLLERRYDNQERRAAAKQVLQSMRNGLAAFGSETTAFEAVLSLNRSLDCLYRVNGDNQGDDEASFLRDQMMDTKARVEAWIALTNAVAGQSAPIHFDSPCNDLP